MEEKKCSKCGDIKKLSEFSRDKGKKDGRDGICSKCRSKMNIARNRSKKGFTSKVYNDQVALSKKRGYEAPKYTREELREWLLNQKLFHKLHKEWAESNYDRWLAPSIDRLDDYKTYSFDNIQLMTWKENDRKGKDDMFNGINNKRSKSVIQYDSNMNFIKEYHSLTQAERETGCFHSNITKCCNNHPAYPRCGGFKWKYKEDQSESDS